ncbi:DNA polymerase III subunit gamma/tau [Patescibacteria group bacterium]|nr:DNA polymerase III subunit gamma/tau [Patescibacteria group bacterium]
MSQTLYRKYRPQAFKDLVDQNHIRITLMNELESGRIAHAYLFTGPRGVGKTTMARLFAKSLNCKNRKKESAEPCNACNSCKDIVKGRLLDLIEIDAASHTGVDNVRQNIIDNSRVATVSSKFKIFIIDEVHMLSISAFNALLKTLEEPPENVVFILATTEVHKVPQTIISRCQRFDFQKVGVKDIIDRLNTITSQEKIQVDEKVLKAIALASDGSVRDAEGMLGQVLSLGEKKVTMDHIDLIVPHSDDTLVIQFLGLLTMGDIASSIELVNRLVEEGGNVKNFVKNIVEVLRKIILLNVSSSLEKFAVSELDEELQKEMTKISSQLDSQELVRWINIFLRIEPILKVQTDIIQLPLEIAILEVIENGKEDSDHFTKGSSPKMPGPVVSSAKRNDNPKSSLKDSYVKKEINRESEEVVRNESVNEDKKEAPVLKLSEVQKKWKTYLKKLREYNHSLALTLNVGKIVEINGNVMTIAFGFQFYLDRVWEAKNKRIIENILEEVYNTPLTFTCIIDNTLREKPLPEPKQKEEETNALKDALDTFGGEVVEG